MAAFLQEYMKTEGLSQRELAERLNLTVSHISRLASGQRKGLDKETLERITGGLGSNPGLKAKLMAAYLWDQCPENTKDLLAITTHPRKHGRVQESASSSADPVTDLASFLRQLPAQPRLVRTLKQLARTAAVHPEFHKLLEQLSKLELPKGK